MSFLSSNKSRLDNDLKLIETDDGRYKVYAFSALYGPNASGKSNFIRGLEDFIAIILFSHSSTLDKPIPAFKPYLLDKQSRNKPVTFEMEFMAKGTRYSYTFSLLEKEILSEELYFYPEGKRALLFLRDRMSAPIINFLIRF